jgi:iron(III) transport system substrate-binding protein
MFGAISMRKRLLLCMVGITVLAAPNAFAASSNEAELYAAAKKEGQVTWYTGHYDQQVTARIANAFTEKYPGVRVNAIKATSQVSFQRLLQELQAGAVQVDVFSSTDASHYLLLKEKGNLVKYIPENASKIFKTFQGIDPDGFFTVTGVSLVAITYNTDKVKAGDAPKNWTDLVDPKWTDQVAVGSPNYSGMVGVWAVLMSKLYGWDFFAKLKAVRPLIGRSIDDSVTLLNSGERKVAAADPATTLRSAAKGNPLAVIYPTDGALAVVEPSGIIKGGPSPNAAKLFMEFLLSPESYRVLVSNFEQTLRSEVPPAPGSKSLSEVKVNIITMDEVSKGIPIAKEKWRDTFGM